MKIIFMLIFEFLLMQNVTFASDFVHIDNDIFIKKNSVTHNNNWYSAIFKTFDEEESSYKIFKYKASCDKRKVLGIVSIFDYGENDILLKEHIIDEQVYPIDPSGYANGYLYYNAICNNAKTH